MNTKSYQTDTSESSPLSVPANLEQKQDEHQQKNRWKGIYATAFAVLVLVAFRAGYTGNRVELQGGSSVVGDVTSDFLECIGSLMKIITCTIGEFYPPIIEGILVPLDPIDLGLDWSQTVTIDVPTCPSTASVEFNLGSIKGLSSIEIQGLTLKEEETECIEYTGNFIKKCVKSSYEAVWTEYIVLQFLETVSTASLEGNVTCLGNITETQLSGTPSLYTPSLRLELHGEGTYSNDIFNPNFEITKATTEAIELEEGTLNVGIFFSAWGNDVFNFESSFEDFIPNEIESFLEDVVKSGINAQINRMLPISFP